MAATHVSRYTTFASPAPAPVPFRRAGSAYKTAQAAKLDPLAALGDDLADRYEITGHGKPTGASLGRGVNRPAARRAGFRTPPR